MLNDYFEKGFLNLWIKDPILPTQNLKGSILIETSCYADTNGPYKGRATIRTSS